MMTSLHLAQVDSAQLWAKARGVENTVMLTDMYLASRLAKNIISYGKLERNFFDLVYDGKESVRFLGVATVPSFLTS